MDLQVGILYCFLALTCLLGGATCEKILLVPVPAHSHRNMLASIGRALVDNGHTVYFLDAEGVDIARYTTPNGLIPIPYKPKLSVDEGSKDFLSSMSIKRFRGEFGYGDMFNIFDFVVGLCSDILGDSNTMAKLLKMKVDFVILPNVSILTCLYLLPYKLGVPYGSYGDFPDRCANRIIAFPSFVPCMALPLTHEMDFKERLMNTVMAAVDCSPPLLADWWMDKLQKQFAPDLRLSLTDLFSKTSLILYHTDPVIDFPRPLLPHLIPVGGLCTKPAQPLTRDLEAKVNGSATDIIVIAFGGLATVIPPETLTKFLQVFRQLSYTVIWQYKGTKIENLPENVIPLEWLPQNDLLGHPKVKLFVTHCGSSSKYEALYHGVAMLALPMMGDQLQNAKTVEYHGFGLQANMVTFTVVELVEKINGLMANNTYSENIKKASAIFRSNPLTPAQRAAFWVGHVIKHGGAHLRSHALDMPFYQYLMLDILAAALLVAVAITMVIILIFVTCRKFFIYFCKADKIKVN